MELTVHHHAGATELVFSRLAAARDQVAAWYVGRVLVDAGGALTSGSLEEWLEGKPLDAVVLGHSHEDHSGGVGALSRRGVAAYGSPGTAARLRRPARVPGYRALLWGQPEPVRVRPPAGLPLEAIPLPGHAPDQLGYIDPQTGWLFSGDLVLRRRQQIAMPGEDPWAMIASLRDVLRLGPTALATSHRGLIADPDAVLREQLDYLEQLAARIAQLRARGLDIDAIVRELFGGEPSPPGANSTWRELSGGEFSARRWVRSFLRPTHEDASSRRRNRAAMRA
ncbi:MAG TPA: MBL fold metallo-hydrolase [Patescibacteria group bacterium]|nr:MBL fold metallo-hydrolase [Patescibacteria group bacterium]